MLDVDPVGIVIPTETMPNWRRCSARRSASRRWSTRWRTPAHAAQIDAAFDTPEPTVEVLDTERGGRRAAGDHDLDRPVRDVAAAHVAGRDWCSDREDQQCERGAVRDRATACVVVGKVIGVGLIGLFALACGALPVLVKLGTRAGSLPPGIASTLAGSAAFFVIGVALYLTSGGALGALVGRQEEAAAAVRAVVGDADRVLHRRTRRVPIRRSARSSPTCRSRRR